MFSYLRPHHKRYPSNPTSPAEHPHQPHSFEPPLHPNSPLDHTHPPRFQEDPKSSSSSLPHIPRVASAESTIEDWNRPGPDNKQRTQAWEVPRSTSRQAEIEVQKNSQRLPSFSVTQRPESAGHSGGSGFKHSSNMRTQGQSGKDGSRSPNPQFVTAADLAGKQTQSGRRPTGVRLPTPPPVAPSQVSNFEPVQPRSGKARLNLLNPMSLLARRRTSQAVPQLLSESLVSKRGTDTYDFQIKGKFVHDFSAPRPKRNISYDSRLHDNGTNPPLQKSPNPQLTEVHMQNDRTATSPWSAGNHTPVFTENFDEKQYPAHGPHVRKANDISDLPLPKPPYAKSSRPISSEGNKVALPMPHHEEKEITSRKSTPDIGPEVPPKEVNVSKRISIEAIAKSSKSIASSTKGRPRKLSEVSTKEGIPKHMKSTSSRFSFDMIGAAEQERLLEERHRQKALDKKNERDNDDMLEDDFDDFDYDDDLEEKIPGVNADLDDEDDMFNDQLLEEEIPGVNADFDEDLEEFTSGNDDLGGFTFQQNFASPLSPYSPGLVSTPRDAHGEVIGFAMTKESPYIANEVAHEPTVESVQQGKVSEAEQPLEGLGLQGVSISQPNTVATENSAVQSSFPHPQNLDVDDLYYDDGIIGDQDLDETAEFDESVFDNVDTDQYGRPIRSLSSLPTLYSPPLLTADPSPSFNKIVETTLDIHDETISPKTSVHATELAPRFSVSNPVQPQQSLTQDSLAAYQSALAEAANRAAAEGKFRRSSTSTFQHSLETGADDPKPSNVGESLHVSYQEPFASSYDLEDDFDYDDLLEDDAIIAAANAEALANDSDGFYGQEFNFYSAPGNGNAEYVHGGYFGSRGMEGIKRSVSGRIASKEPNLTPITERSEYSNRNSVMGFSMNKGDIVSPGLAQLAGMLREEEDSDLSLDGLMKLRRGAWGGSQASLHSSNGGTPKSAGLDDGSPLNGQPPWTAGGPLKQPLYARRNSGFSGASIISEASLQTANAYGKTYPNKGMEIGPPVSEPTSQPPSPTFVRSSSVIGIDHIPISPRSPRSPRSPNGLHSPTSISSPMSRGGSNEGYMRGRDDNWSSFRKHRHTGSADSISYLKEEDPINGDRWILERRRTGDSGEIEVGREVISSGRI